MDIVFRYRAREISIQDIDFIKGVISAHYKKGRTYISKLLCKSWNWVQPNGRYKEYAARDLLLRLEEKGYIELPPRLKNNKDNLKERSYEQIPLFVKEDLSGVAGDYQDISIKKVSAEDEYLWSYLLHDYHYLGLPRLVGECGWPRRPRGRARGCVRDRSRQLQAALLPVRAAHRPPRAGAMPRPRIPPCAAGLRAPRSRPRSSG